jgi:quercetin dioxygenase-like cupin family protein
MPSLGGEYDLHPLDALALQGAQSAKVGVVRIAAGTRSPSAGLRASARHEIAYIVAGSARVDTPEGSATVSTGDVIVSSPAELHATTALTDTTIFYILIDPAPPAT